MVLPSGCSSRIYRFSSLRSESLVAGGGLGEEFTQGRSSPVGPGLFKTLALSLDFSASDRFFNSPLRGAFFILPPSDGPFGEELPKRFKVGLAPALQLADNLDDFLVHAHQTPGEDVRDMVGQF